MSISQYHMECTSFVGVSYILGTCLEAPGLWTCFFFSSFVAAHHLNITMKSILEFLYSRISVHVDSTACSEGEFGHEAHRVPKLCQLHLVQVVRSASLKTIWPLVLLKEMNQLQGSESCPETSRGLQSQAMKTGKTQNILRKSCLQVEPVNINHLSNTKHGHFNKMRNCSGRREETS